MPPRPANFVFSVETGFLHVGQAGLELPTSGDPPASASQSAEIYRHEPPPLANLGDLTKVPVAKLTQKPYKAHVPRLCPGERGNTL